MKWGVVVCLISWQLIWMHLSLQVQHPAAKMLVMASHMQEQEAGDGTNFVLVFAGVLLELAEELLRMGLSVSEVNGFNIFPFEYLCVLLILCFLFNGFTFF